MLDRIKRLDPRPAPRRAACRQARAGRPAQLRQPAGGRARRARARQQADRGALLPQRRLRRPGRLQAEAGRQRQRRRAVRAPLGRRRRQGWRHRREGHRQRGGGAAALPQCRCRAERRTRDRGAGHGRPRRPPHRVLRRRQLRHRGAGRAAQVLPPRRHLGRGQRRPHAGDERDDARARRLRRDHQQLRPQPRPARRGRDRAQEGRHGDRDHCQRLAAGHWRRRTRRTTSCWPPTTRKTPTATARWCRGCCT